MAAVNGTRVCVVDRCDRPAKGEYCGAHYQRVAKHGDPRADVPIQSRTRLAGERCAVDGCERPRANGPSGLCQPHYHRKWRGNDDQSPIAPARARPLPVEDMPDGRRRCLECREVLDLESGFHRDSKGPGGYRKTCKVCRVAAETKRYWEDPAGAAARVRAFREANPDHVRSREAEYYLKHREARIDAAVEAVHRRRAQIAGVRRDRGITKSALRKMDGDACCYCGRAMMFGRIEAGARRDDHATLEHVTALARGGTHTWDNCALACWRCNIAKGARDGDWAVREGHRLARRRVEVGA